MNLYKTTIYPSSNFTTPIRGDTLFGQFCWAICYAFGGEKLNELLQSYEDSPFCVISDAFAPGFLPKPNLPSFFMKEGDDKKANRKKIWMSYNDLLEGNFLKAQEVDDKDTAAIQMHNSINYKTFKTGDGFAPYGVKEHKLQPKDVYLLLDENKFSKEEFEKSFTLLSTMGYGQDSTIGKGRFTLSELQGVEQKHSKTIMTLSPFSPQGLACKEIYYNPFTRFGKKGADRAHENPFKKPLLLADTGAVIIYDAVQTKGYIGRAIKGHTSHEDIVHQGYAIAIGIKDL